MFQKIGAIIEFIFTAAIGVACGLVCYYYVWLSGWTMVGKVFAMIGFCLWAIFAMFWTIFFGVFMIDDHVELDKDNVEFAIFAMIIAFVIPGLIYLIDLFVDGRDNKNSGYTSENTGTNYTIPKTKKKVEKYNPDDDPAVIRRTTETRTPKGAPGSTTGSTPKKRMVK